MAKSAEAKKTVQFTEAQMGLALELATNAYNALRSFERESSWRARDFYTKQGKETPQEILDIMNSMNARIAQEFPDKSDKPFKALVMEEAFYKGAAISRMDDNDRNPYRLMKTISNLGLPGWSNFQFQSQKYEGLDFSDFPFEALVESGTTKPHFIKCNFGGTVPGRWAESAIFEDCKGMEHFTAKSINKVFTADIAPEAKSAPDNIPAIHNNASNGESAVIPKTVITAKSQPAGKDKIYLQNVRDIAKFILSPEQISDKRADIDNLINNIHGQISGVGKNVLRNMLFRGSLTSTIALKMADELDLGNAEQKAGLRTQFNKHFDLQAGLSNLSIGGIFAVTFLKQSNVVGDRGNAEAFLDKMKGAGHVTERDLSQIKIRKDITESSYGIYVGDNPVGSLVTLGGMRR